MQLIFIICSVLLHLLLLPQTHSLTPEGLALLSLKSAITSDPTHSLSSWSESDPSPCHWPGISCSDNNNVTSISLNNLRLAGYISSELTLLHSLVSLDLSHNSLSGRIPDSIGSLQLLSNLDLSSNQLEGSLPESLVQLRSLTGTLNLSWNRFSGEIPESYGRFPVRVSLDLGHNNLTGQVPLVGSLVNQGPTAFSGNPSLCGFPLQTPCPEAVNVNIPPRRRRNGGDGGSDGDGEDRIRDVEKATEKRGSVAVPLISGMTVVIGAITVSAWLVRRKYVAAAAATEKGKMGKDEKETNIIVHYHGGEEGQKGKFVVEEEEGQKGKFVVMDDEGFCLELEDLLRASAYVAGKGRSGILYKVVVGGRSVVAVRRLNDGGGAWRLKEFETEVEAIGKVQHPNIVRLRAYYYASDEKLLVSDFVCNGSLYTALHGNKTPEFIITVPIIRSVRREFWLALECSLTRRTWESAATTIMGIKAKNRTRSCKRDNVHTRVHPTQEQRPPPRQPEIHQDPARHPAQPLHLRLRTHTSPTIHNHFSIIIIQEAAALLEQQPDSNTTLVLERLLGTRGASLGGQANSEV
ncbi:Receptor protein kinase-like protein ZAR1 [Linum grandiflorum]